MQRYCGTVLTNFTFLPFIHYAKLKLIEMKTTVKVCFIKGIMYKKSVLF